MKPPLVQIASDMRFVSVAGTQTELRGETPVPGGMRELLQAFPCVIVAREATAATHSSGCTVQAVVCIGDWHGTPGLRDLGRAWRRIPSDGAIVVTIAPSVTGALAAIKSRVVRGFSRTSKTSRSIALVRGHPSESIRFAWRGRMGRISFLSAVFFSESLTKLQLLASDDVLVVSDALAKQLEIPPYIVAPEIDWEALLRFRTTTQVSTDSVLFVGRLEREKGADLVIPSVAEALSARRLRIVGSGSLHALMQEQAAQVRDDLHIDFLGPLDHTQVLDEMARAQVLLVPSRSEGFGLVAFEGLALGANVCVTRVGGLPEATEWAREHTDWIEPDVKSIAAGLERSLRLDRTPNKRINDAFRESQPWTTLKAFVVNVTDDLGEG